MSKPDLTLYTNQTPNGIKISIALSLLSLPYKVKVIDLSTHQQKSPPFVAINPNGRIPALTDHSPPLSSPSSSSSHEKSKNEPLHIMESGAILLYLAQTYDNQHKISFEYGSREHWEMIQWLFWQNAGLGPMQGQANHFVRYSPEKIPYGVTRYVNETRRLYSVLEKRLQEQREKRGSGFIVGDHVSIADISVFGWAIHADWAGVDLAEFPGVKKWMEGMEGIEEVEEGRNVPVKSDLRGMKMDDEEGVEKYAAGSRRWILEGMQRDAERK